MAKSFVKIPIAIHPLCKMFGQLAPLSKQEKAELTEDIKNRGIIYPILVNKKKDTILDGATRWGIAYDLKIDLPAEAFEVFPSEDEEEIKAEIISRNMRRRHMSDEQRVAIVSKLRGPDLEKEARERQSKAGTFKGKATIEGKGSVAAQIAQEAGVSQHKASQAEKARKAGTLEDVISGKAKLRSAAKKAPSKPRKKAAVPFEDQVWKKWTQWVNRYPHAVRNEVIGLVKGWLVKNRKP